MKFKTSHPIGYPDGYTLPRGEEIELDITGNLEEIIAESVTEPQFELNYKGMYPIPVSALNVKCADNPMEVGILMREIEHLKKGSLFIHPLCSSSKYRWKNWDLTYRFADTRSNFVSPDRLKALLSKFLYHQALKYEKGEVYMVFPLQPGRLCIRHKYGFTPDTTVRTVDEAINVFEGLVSLRAV